MTQKTLSKLQQAKLAKARELTAPKKIIKRVTNVNLDELKNEISKLGEQLKELKPKAPIDTTDKLIETNDKLSELIGKLEQGIEVTNLDKLPKFNPEIKIPETKPPIIKVPEPIIKQAVDIFDVYKPADRDEKTSSKYYGFLAKSGAWFILRDSETNNIGSDRYVGGTNNYQKAWNNRQSLEYVYLSEAQIG